MQGTANALRSCKAWRPRGGADPSRAGPFVATLLLDRPRRPALASALDRRPMRRFTARQALNTGLNEVEFRLQSTVVRSLPQNVDIVLTKACNLACTFCVDYETPGAKRISLETFEKVARQLFPTAPGEHVLRRRALPPQGARRPSAHRASLPARDLGALERHAAERGPGANDRPGGAHHATRLLGGRLRGSHARGDSGRGEPPHHPREDPDAATHP